MSKFKLIVNNFISLDSDVKTIFTIAIFNINYF